MNIYYLTKLLNLGTYLCFDFIRNIVNYNQERFNCDNIIAVTFTNKRYTKWAKLN